LLGAQAAVREDTAIRIRVAIGNRHSVLETILDTRKQPGVAHKLRGVERRR
jgi:hypothetical protein